MQYRILGTLKFKDAQGNIYELAPADNPVESADYPGCYYRTVDGNTEWLNPPLVLNTEYLTTERWNGKAVYTMLLDCGNSVAGTKVIEYPFAASGVIRYSGKVGGIVVPCADGNDNTDFSGSWSAQMHVGTTFANVICGSSLADGKIYLHLWYVK